MDNSVLAFDIETIPDIAGLRALHDFPKSLDDQAVLDMSLRLERQSRGSDFLPLSLHKILVISGVFCDKNCEIKIFSLNAWEGEQKAIQQFFALMKKHTPQLISWNGTGFDMPVMHYRSLIYNISAPIYWETGKHQQSYRFNNYLSRYHEKHLDLMDILALYQPRSYVKLDLLAKQCGLPGKIGMDGGEVYQAWCDGRIAEIKNYCESDAVNTYLLYLRFQKMRGVIENNIYLQLTQDVRKAIERRVELEPQWQEFLDSWGCQQDHILL